MRNIFRLWLTLVTLLVASATLLAPTASADRSFTQRFGQIDRGDIMTVGNTIMTCPTAAVNCVAARAGGNYPNESFTMGYVDVDADPTTFDSSRADLSLPAGSTVLFAGLYWGADTSAGGSGAAAPNAAANNTVKLAVPAGAYQTVTASQLDTGTSSLTRYQGFADVTSKVQSGGSGTYTVANVQAGTGSDRYGGWALVVAYHDAAQNLHWIGVYDGYSQLNFGGTMDATLTGFQTPPSGLVHANFGMVSYEGDISYTGDSAQLNGTTLTDAVHPSTNYWDSVISRNGANLTAKSPNYVNQLGFDANVMSAAA